MELLARKPALLATSLLCLCSLSSCKSISPHENFKAHMTNNIGRSMDDARTQWVSPDALVDTKKLANGNLENQYRWQGTCRYFFEFDPKTRFIVNWRFEGTQQGCGIVP